MITTAGRNLIRNALTGANAGITYLAWGNGTSTPAPGQIKLDNELGRKTITSYNATSDGVEKILTIITATEGNANITELALFGGASTTATKDSGVMFERVLYSRNKTNLESWQVDMTTIFDILQ